MKRTMFSSTKWPKLKRDTIKGSLNSRYRKVVLPPLTMSTWWS